MYEFRPPSTLRWRSSTSLYGFVFEENLLIEITWLSWRHHFRKLPFENVFRPHESEKSAFSNSCGVKSLFEKLGFRDGLVWKVGVTVEINWSCIFKFPRRSVEPQMSEKGFIFCQCRVVKPSMENHKFSRLFTPTTLKKSVPNDCFYIRNNAIQFKK